MNTHTVAVIATIALSVVGAMGDYFLKHASTHENPLNTGYFVLGLVFFSSTAIGWVYVMRHLKLATIGTVYCVATVILLVGIGMLFGERLSGREVLGVALGVGSVVLLTRFS